MSYIPTQPPRRYLFIDGRNFGGTLDRLAKRLGEPIPIDHEKIGSGFNRVFYYDALPQDEAKRLETEAFHSKLRGLPNWHVRTGETRKSSKGSQKQKAVDVLMAIEAYQHAMLGNMDEATFIASDLDFLPLYEALVQTRVQTRLFFEPDNADDALVHSVDLATRIDFPQVSQQWCSDDQFRVRAKLSIQDTLNIKMASDIEHYSTTDGDEFVIAQMRGHSGYFGWLASNVKGEHAQRALYAPDVKFLLVALEDDAGKRRALGSVR